MNEKILFMLIFVFGVFISSVAQIFLKKSAQKEYESKIKEYLNPTVILSYCVFFAATLCTIIAYKKIPLSLGPILESSGYIFIAVLSYLFLKEKISKKKLLGLATIIIGIIIYAL